MKIENNILEISKVMFTNKHHWEHITNEQKEQFFFIFNRYFSKRYTDLAQLLNDKSIDKTIGMDLWFYKMKNEPYPQWFWSKTKKTIKDENSDFVTEIKQIHSFTDQEIKFIEENYPQELEEEINYLKLQKNGNTREKVVHRKGTK